MSLGDPSQHQSDTTQWEEAHGGKAGVNRTFNKQDGIVEADRPCSSDRG